MAKQEKLVPLTHEWSADMWDWPLQRSEEGVKVVNTAQKFQVQLQVPGFNPKEVEVRVSRGDLIILCHHEQRDGEDLMIEKSVIRTYKLPKDVDETSIKSHLNPQNILEISGLKKGN